jgi:3',5'-cyclic AMP phosphodiesterase CpdA
MRLLHCTDLHFHQPWFEWLTKVGPYYEACCVSGDLLDQHNATKRQLKAQVAWITNWAMRFPGTLFLCSGNHDSIDDQYENPSWMQKLDRAVWVDGGLKPVRGIWIRLLGWTDWIEGEPLGPEVIVTHVGPAASNVSWSDGSSHGDSELLVSIRDRGALVLCGHVHTPLRWWDYNGTSLSLNPGCDFSQAIPNHVIVNLSRRTARHIVGGKVRDKIVIKRKTLT